MNEKPRPGPKFPHFDGAGWPRPTFGSAGTLPMTDEEKEEAKKREQNGKPPFGFVAPEEEEQKPEPTLELPSRFDAEEAVRYLRSRTEW